MSFIKNYFRARSQKKEADKKIKATKAEVSRQQKSSSILRRGARTMQEGNLITFAKERARRRKGKKDWWK
jgi:hypothetical protein